MSVLLSIPIAILYNLLVGKSIEIITKDYQMKEKTQINIVMQFIAGILAIALAFIIFGGNNKAKNLIAKYGLIFGGSVLLIYSTFYNWHVIDDMTKLIFFGLLFVIVIGYSYKKINNTNKKQKQNQIYDKKQNNYKKEEEDDDIDDE